MLSALAHLCYSNDGEVILRKVEAGQNIFNAPCHARDMLFDNLSLLGQRLFPACGGCSLCIRLDLTLLKSVHPCIPCHDIHPGSPTKLYHW